MIVLLYPATEDQSYRFYLFKYVNTSWRLVPGVNTYRTLAGIWVSPSGKAYFGGYGLNKLDGEEFINIYGPISVTSVYGLDDRDVFFTALKDGGRFYYYNGRQVYEYEELFNPDVLYTGVWSYGSEVFVSGFTMGGFPNKTIIWHGKLP
ncbi:MAG TPA: hypothetical protein ENJ89_04740 [Caldithrix abyssi]|uniref:Uncharacterized protein n=1 Tax=Caldithrix abyssi TaxID=187145 RepID=A0A7V5UES7_CALAY|nr:hypothetical protein [Caldithrix abyssi]